MGKARKSDTVTNTGAIAAPIIDVDVVKSTKTSKTAAKAVASKTSKTSKMQEVAVTNEIVALEEPPVVESGFTDTFSEFMSKLQTIASQINSLKSEFRTLEKKAVREIKIAQKINAKRKRKTSNRAPSGFVKPTLISTELANFLNKPIGTEMARTEVTREINGYIRAHNLQDKQNGRKINPDTLLASLLKIGDGEELTYFNLQRYMSPHFAKANAKVPDADNQAAAASAAAATKKKKKK